MKRIIKQHNVDCCQSNNKSEQYMSKKIFKYNKFLYIYLYNYIYNR